MRYDTAVYFETVTEGEYNEETGDYAEDKVTEVEKYASVNYTGIETLKIVFGDIRQGNVTIKLPRPYKKPFDRIRIGGKLYSVDYENPLRNKTVFVASEVQ